ncbi:hypothetical protein LPJ61_000997 [Coemansia biformis]|uniref:G domain-containing protein n=1 Tax=Coemansia biformis TaxID=1286918 RepID=A0A9W7YIK2_9FUNG|nr:hypothetical protein LPJ61_000997 [Coemansia biformis]
MPRPRSVHGTAAAGATLGRIRRILEQARPGSGRSSDQATEGAAKPPASQVPARAQAQSQEQARARAQAQEQARARALALEYQPADPMLGMPKTFGAFAQPADAEVARIMLLGVANAGKSTLVNLLVGGNVSIVSPRPQTTRSRIMAAVTVGSRQLVFLDTPGVVSRQALRRVARSVVTAPWATLPEADCVVLLLDGYKLTHKTCEAEGYLLRHLDHAGASAPPILLAINKIDLVEDRALLLEKVRGYQAQHSAIAGTPLLVSARDNVGVDELREQLLARTRPGRWAVPEGVASDMSDLTRVEELIRAEWFERLSGHMPYAVRQRNAGWDEAGAGAAGARPTLTIKQELVVSSAGEAVILVGAGGSVVRDMAQAASRAISGALGRPARVHLQVVVEEDTRRQK